MKGLQVNTHGEKSRAFKFKVMELHIKDGVPIKVLAEQFGLLKQTIYNWREQYRRYGDEAFVGCGRQRPADTELRRLCRELEDLRMENELLKNLRHIMRDKKAEGIIKDLRIQ